MVIMSTWFNSIEKNYGFLTLDFDLDSAFDFDILRKKYVKNY